MRKLLFLLLSCMLLASLTSVGVFAKTTALRADEGQMSVLTGCAVFPCVIHEPEGYHWSVLEYVSGLYPNGRACLYEVSKFYAHQFNAAESWAELQSLREAMREDRSLCRAAYRYNYWNTRVQERQQQVAVGLID